MKKNTIINSNTLFAIGLTSMITSISLAEESKMGLFIEPAITYESGDTSTSYPSPFSNSSGKIEGFGLGARLGPFSPGTTLNDVNLENRSWIASVSFPVEF